VNADTSRLRFGDVIAALSGVVLIIALFLPWFRVTGETPELAGGETREHSAWAAMALIDKLLLIAAVVAIGLAVLRVVGTPARWSVSPELVALIVSVFAVLLVLFRLARVPSGLFPDVPELSVTREIGIFVALAATLGMTLGSWLSWRGEGKPTVGAAARGRTQPVPPA
jgi:hypothetical protein